MPYHPKPPHWPRESEMATRSGHLLCRRLGRLGSDYSNFSTTQCTCASGDVREICILRSSGYIFYSNLRTKSPVPYNQSVRLSGCHTCEFDGAVYCCSVVLSLAMTRTPLGRRMSSSSELRHCLVTLRLAIAAAKSSLLRH